MPIEILASTFNTDFKNLLSLSNLNIRFVVPAEKAVKATSFIKDSMGKLKKIPNYSGLHAHFRGIVDNGTVRTEMYDDD